MYKYISASRNFPVALLDFSEDIFCHGLTYNTSQTTFKQEWDGLKLEG